MPTDDQLKALILHKLFMKRCWGGKHTDFENLKKGVKIQELGKEGLRRIDKLAKELIREGFILTKPAHYGLQVSLNPRLSQEILQKVKQFFPEV